MKTLLILLFFIAGCSVKSGGELTTPSVSPSPTPSTNYLTTTEVNSGAQTLVTTSGNYTVAHAIKSSGEMLKTQSTNGYKVYLNVQGTYYAEGP